MGYMDYTKFFNLLEKKKLNQFWLRNNGIHSRVTYKMKNHEDINTKTLCQLCALLKCQPKDIMEYVEGEPNDQ